MENRMSPIPPEAAEEQMTPSPAKQEAPPIEDETLFNGVSSAIGLPKVDPGESVRYGFLEDEPRRPDQGEEMV